MSDISNDPRPSRVRRLLQPVLMGLGAAASVASLFMLAGMAQNARLFGALQPWLLLVNAAGVLVLLGLLGGKLYDLARDLRRHVPGSRMKARAVGMFSALALPPIALVVYFALNAINGSIDSWFDVGVQQGLRDALSLSRAALSLRTRDFLTRTSTLGAELRGERDADIVVTLDRVRRFADAAELIVIGDHGRILAASSATRGDALPALPTEEVVLQARQGRPYVSLDPNPSGGYRVITAVGIGAPPDPRVLVASYDVPEQLATLGDHVQASYAKYGQRVYQRPFLKWAFTLTLCIALLVAALLTVYGAFFWAARLVQPVQDLIMGTRAVAKGHLDTRLPLPSHDEMGYLVHSFNDMTKRLARAREDADRSTAAVERQRQSLAVILARLSTGVISLEPDLRLSTANAAASGILSYDLESLVGKPLADVAAAHPLVEQFVAACRRHLDAGQTEWREQLQLRSETGRRELTVACTALPGEDGAAHGLVIVFDDITTLLQAQRDAAWGEVARRLAHEIKNPLTPIQLSAERMRRKLLGAMNEKDAEILERATQTIVHQVETMKQMVNAFSDYARAPAMQVVSFDANQLTREVVELYRAQDPRVGIRLALDPDVGPIQADRGRVRQILNNLLTNALEALEGRKGAEIVVSTERGLLQGNPALELTVRDNGPGFQPDIIGQIFDPYVTSKTKGTGLGLSIVKKIVEEHGGRIEAENVPEGGARIRVLLPQDAPDRAAGPREARRPEPRRERV
jgi:nitrogen fixation/metabolism regulation signal transduction histidine kinase